MLKDVKNDACFDSWLLLFLLISDHRSPIIPQSLLAVTVMTSSTVVTP